MLLEGCTWTPKPFSPSASSLTGQVECGEVSTLRGQWTYENDFLPLTPFPEQGLW